MKTMKMKTALSQMMTKSMTIKEEEANGDEKKQNY
jgi:hypothetical protein